MKKNNRRYIHNMKDFIYDTSDVIAVLGIIAVAAAVIIWRVSVMMNY